MCLDACRPEPSPFKTWDPSNLRLTSTFMSMHMQDGIPTTLLNEFPEIKAYHNRVAALPAVAKMYENVTEGPRLSYKVLP